MGSIQTGIALTLNRDPAPEERHVNSKTRPQSTQSPGGVKQNNLRFPAYFQRFSPKGV
jgi:hypothetical protein